MLIVHAGVRGALGDASVLFVYMAIAKDIERVNDLAKDIVNDLAKDMWHLAAPGVDMSQDSHLQEAKEVGDKVKGLIAGTARGFGERDSEAAIEILNQSDTDVDVYEARMHGRMGGRRRPHRRSRPPSSTAT